MIKYLCVALLIIALLLIYAWLKINRIEKMFFEVEENNIKILESIVKEIKNEQRKNISGNSDRS